MPYNKIFYETFFVVCQYFLQNVVHVTKAWGPPDDDTVGVAPSLILAHVRQFGSVAAVTSPQFGCRIYSPLSHFSSISSRSFLLLSNSTKEPLSFFYCKLFSLHLTLYTVLVVQPSMPLMSLYDITRDTK